MIIHLNTYIIGIDGGPNYKNYLGLNVTTYTFDMADNSINGYNVVRHSLNVMPMNDLTEEQSEPIINFKDANYVWEPFISNVSTSDNNIISGYEAQFDNFTINIGFSKEPSVNSSNTYYYDGYFRNLTFFKGHLTANEEASLFRLGILNDYEWHSDYEDEQLKELINSGEFFLGLVSIYDSNNINIINCESKYDGTTYKID